MAIYDIDFSLVAERLLPPNKRNPVMLAWITALFTPLQQLHDDIFTNYRPDVIFRTRYNSQTIVLEGILNFIFDVQSVNKIYIDNTDNNLDQVFFYKETEGYLPVFFSTETEDEPVYFYNEDEYLVDFDFIVYVPSTWTDSSTSGRSFSDFDLQIENEVEKYRIMGTNYEVLSY
jgi:hypothetical protein